MELNDILALTTMRHDLDKEITIRQYFYDLMAELWTKEDRFSGKRPFGNSGWQGEVYVPLIRHGLIPGELDEDGYIKTCDWNYAQQFVLTHIILPLFALKP